MASTSMSATIEKIRVEAATFENKDRLLCFSQKNKFQSPLFFDYGDKFFEAWQNEKNPRALISFFPVSAKYNEEMQKTDLERFRLWPYKAEAYQDMLVDFIHLFTSQTT